MSKISRAKKLKGKLIDFHGKKYCIIDAEYISYNDDKFGLFISNPGLYLKIFPLEKDFKNELLQTISDVSSNHGYNNHFVIKLIKQYYHKDADFCFMKPGHRLRLNFV